MNFACSLQALSLSPWTWPCLQTGYRYIPRTLASFNTEPGFSCVDHNTKMDKQTFTCGNSQRNKSLNSVVGSKNPKIRFYGGSESNDYECMSCSVSQVNLGYRYIPRTLASFNTAPGFSCVDHNTKMEKKSSMDKQRKSTVTFKRRRSQKNEAKEGTMYESGIGLNLNSSATAME